MFKFKFNPEAVPFIPSVERERGKTVLSRMDGLHRAFWKHDEPLLDGFGRIDEMEEELYFSYLPSHMFDSNEKEIPEKQTFDIESVLDENLSSWFLDRGMIIHSQEGSSVCDECWSATPMSRASPPLTDDHDHNSSSYGSLPSNSFSVDLTMSECSKEQSELSDAKMDQLEMSSCDGSNEMRYYSPFETGVSTWLASERRTKEEGSLKDKEHVESELSEGVKKDLQTVGNIWNNVDCSESRSAAIHAWVKQISQDSSEGDLFADDKLRDEIYDEAHLYEFLSVDQNPWLSSCGKNIGSSSKLNWAEQDAWQRHVCTAENNRNAFLSFSHEPNQNSVSMCHRQKLDSKTGQFFQASRSRPNVNGCRNRSKRNSQTNISWLDHQATPMMAPDRVVCLPQFGQEIMAQSVSPVFFVPSPVSFHQSARHFSVYNPYMMHFPPQLQGFSNLDCHISMPQFYPSVYPVAFNRIGSKNQGYFPLNRHSGSPPEVHQKLDICYEQFRNLENKRKKTEAEMARQYPGKEVNSDNTLKVPPMPPTPSRVDRLVVEMLREHARVATLVSRMAQLRGIEFEPSLLLMFQYWMEGAQKLQTCRRNEMINRRKYRTDVRGVAQKEKDTVALVDALSNLAILTRTASAALWCALQLTVVDLPVQSLEQADAMPDQETGSNSNLNTELDGPHEVLEEDSGFFDYQREFLMDSDLDDGKDEPNKELFGYGNEDELDCETSESDLQETGYGESDYESCSLSDDAGGKDGALYNDQYHLQSKETKSLDFSEGLGKESDSESKSVMLTSCEECGLK